MAWLAMRVRSWAHRNFGKGNDSHAECFSSFKLMLHLNRRMTPLDTVPTGAEQHVHSIFGGLSLDFRRKLSAMSPI